MLLKGEMKLANYYKTSVAHRLKRLEQTINEPHSPVLFVDLNEDGTYGRDNFTQIQLDQYVKEKGYDVVIIDDII